MTKPPPWIQTRTGRPAPSSPGVQTFSVRQSSSIGPTSKGSAGPSALELCQADDPKRVASRRPDQGGSGAGGRKRRGPTGGAAYGMPRKT